MQVKKVDLPSTIPATPEVSLEQANTGQIASLCCYEISVVRICRILYTAFELELDVQACNHAGRMLLEQVVSQRENMHALTRPVVGCRSPMVMRLQHLLWKHHPRHRQAPHQ